MSWYDKVYVFLTAVMSKWSAELSALMTLAITLLSLELIDLWVIKLLFTICIFLFFGGVIHKFILAVYKQHILTLKEIKKCEGKKHNVE